MLIPADDAPRFFGRLNHAVELAAPFALFFGPRKARIWAGLLQLFFQACITGTGNYAFINWISCVPFFGCFDDAFLAGDDAGSPVLARAGPAILRAAFLGGGARRDAAVAAARAAAAAAQQAPGSKEKGKLTAVVGDRGGDGDDTGGGDGEGRPLLRPAAAAVVPGAASTSSSSSLDRAADHAATSVRRVYGAVRLAVHLALVAFIAQKSIAPVKELMSDSPWLHYYDQYFFVNAHGVFGFINAKRYELVLHYTHEQDRAAVEASVYSGGDPEAAARAAWAPLDFKCLPGTLGRRPCVVTPYHYRFARRDSAEHFFRSERAAVHSYGLGASCLRSALRAIS